MRLSLLLLLLAGTACVPQPVAWGETAAIGDGGLADSLRLALDSAGQARLVPAWTPPSWPDEPAACRATRRAVQASDGAAYASWLAIRPDSSVRLRIARSDDGGHVWEPAVTADSTDVGTAGCDRPVPFLAADALNGWVHLAYFLVAREGAGLFFTHSMERGARWHEPVPIVYGDRPSRAAVASRGDTVVVVYEDPNSRLPRIGMALSRTQGHIFESRPPVSEDNGESTGPQVAVRGGRVIIVWTTSQRGGRWPRTVQREGTLTW
ncbi:MAG: exo-alpha-sialidase [Gemmatimonadetes bacterium]|nr:exo-alpha-sialidase [Gemmatimonadota bacterium]